ncbi:hypothetical protein GCM10027089_49390 [Nocardia thraciensis]
MVELGGAAVALGVSVVRLPPEQAVTVTASTARTIPGTVRMASDGSRPGAGPTARDRCVAGPMADDRASVTRTANTYIKRYLSVICAIWTCRAHGLADLSPDQQNTLLAGNLSGRPAQLPGKIIP